MDVVNDTNSNVLQSPDNPSPITLIKTDALAFQSTSTDFENLIEMNARKTNVITGKITPSEFSSTFESPKPIGTITAIVSPFSMAVVPSTSSSPSSTTLPSFTSGSKFLKSSSIPTVTAKSKLNTLQPMEIDDLPPKPVHTQLDLSTPKYHLNMENSKLINKVKIVVDNITNNSSTAKIRSDLYENNNNNNYQLSQHPNPHLHHLQQIHQPLFSNFNLHGNLHLYEYNQNNQNILNQNKLEFIHNNNNNNGNHNNNNALDENMWRPW